MNRHVSDVLLDITVLVGEKLNQLLLVRKVCYYWG